MRFVIVTAIALATFGSATQAEQLALHRSDSPYSWIDRYQDEDGAPCCGDKDCDVVPDGRVQETPTGYRLLDYGVTWPYRKTHPSADGKSYLCSWAGKHHCFFHPLSGS